MVIDLEEVLDRRLKLVNEWLFFAEKKNATLLVFNVGIIWGVSRILKDFEDLHWVTEFCLVIGAIAISLSVLCCIFSFFSVLMNGNTNKRLPTSNIDNGLFFGHIANYSIDEYIEFLKFSYSNDLEFLKCHRDYIDQIIINSRIAKAKYELFNIALYLSAFVFWLLLFMSLFEVF